MPWSNGDIATAVATGIAFAALIRPDITAFFRSRQTKVDVHPAGRAEIGFSTLGPTVSLQGTVRAVGGNVFVSSAHVMIERVADHLRHEFEWAVFKPLILNVTGPQQAFEIASGFYLESLSPKRFNVQFNDSSTAAKYQNLLTDLERSWLNYLNDKNILLANISPVEVQKVFNAFHESNKPQFQKTYELMGQVFYWLEGEYKMTLRLETSRPDKTYSTDFKFSLTPEECAQLRQNIFPCMLSKCNQTVFWNFAYAVYSKVDKTSV